MEPFDQGPAHHRNGQSDGHIDHRDLAPKDAGQQDQATQIHHGRGDQNENVTPSGSPALVNPIKAGSTSRSKGSPCPEGRTPYLPPSRESAPAASCCAPAEVALDIRNHKNQQAQQQSDLDCVVQKELDAPAPAGGRSSPRADTPRPISTFSHSIPRTCSCISRPAACSHCIMDSSFLCPLDQIFFDVFPSKLPAPSSRAITPLVIRRLRRRVRSPTALPPRSSFAWHMASSAAAAAPQQPGRLFRSGGNGSHFPSWRLVTTRTRIKFSYDTTLRTAPYPAVPSARRHIFSPLRSSARMVTRRLGSPSALNSLAFSGELLPISSHHIKIF